MRAPDLKFGHISNVSKRGEGWRAIGRVAYEEERVSFTRALKTWSLRAKDLARSTLTGLVSPDFSLFAFR